LNIIVDRIVEYLSMPPEPLSSLVGIGTVQPSTDGSLPAIVTSLTLQNDRNGYVGHFSGSGFKIVQNTATVEVGSCGETIEDDLRSLLIWPLPLKKNPSSVEEGFTARDVRVRNVTDADRPVDYRMVDGPAEAEEYTVDVSEARIIFGMAQRKGEKIEVTHWTVAWRADLHAEQYGGTIRFEVWAGNPGQADDLSRRLQDKLTADRPALRQKGFLTLGPAGLGAIEHNLHTPPVGSPFAVWRQNLDYRFIFETSDGAELSSGTRIRRIDVDMNRGLGESLVVPK
jgi:hypothetical protein